MNRHYDKYLTKKYPKLFRDRYASIQHSCMGFGFECGDGWFNIIRALAANIQHHIDWTRKDRAESLKFNRALMKWVEKANDRDLRYYCTFNGMVDEYMLESTKLNPKLRKVREACPQVVVVQVKEKFGSLRFYYNGGDDTIDGMVRMAEAISSVTCEVCGDKGKISGNGWYSCRCNKHKKD